MTTALTWLLPRPLSPVVVAGPTGPATAACRYEGLLRPVHDEAVAAADLLVSPAGRAAVLGEGVAPGAAVARLSAAWVHTGRHRPRRIAVVVPAAARHEGHRGPVHRQIVRPGDIASYGGVPVTTPVRTAVDLLCFTTGPAAGHSVRALLRAGLDPADVLDYLDRVMTRAPVRAAARRLREMLDQVPLRAPVMR